MPLGNKAAFFVQVVRKHALVLMQVHKYCQSWGAPLDKYTNKYYYKGQKVLLRVHKYHRRCIVCPKIYCGERKTLRPVQLARPFPPADLQGALPLAWCSRCGGEIFRSKRELCQRCVSYERRRSHEKRKRSQPLPVLHTGP